MAILKINLKLWAALTIFAFLFGFVLYALNAGWVVVRLPGLSNLALTMHKPAIKRQVDLFFWNHATWQQEQVEMVWPSDLGESVQNLVSRWFVLAQQEGLVCQRVLVQSCACNGVGHVAYVSLDCVPFSPEGSIFEKMMILEGILKTVAAAGCPLSGMQFLVHHQPIIDPHLDLSYPWPLTGFVS